MKLKITLKNKHIIRYLYILIILINIILLFFLFSFMKKNVYYAIVPNEDLSVFASKNYAGDIDIKKFEDIIKLIEKKSIKNDLDNIENIFD